MHQRNHQALPPSPFAKRTREPVPMGTKQGGSGEALQGRINAQWNGREEPRSRTATKLFGTNFQGDSEQAMHRSAIEQLQNLQIALVDPPTKTELLINTKRTFEELHIRKSSSFDRDRIELSLSSDYVDFYSENTQLKRKIEELQRNNADLISRGDAARIRMEELQFKLKECQLRLQNAESQCSRASIMITQYENELALKEGWIQELKGQLLSTNRQVKEWEERSKSTGVDLQAHKNHFQNQRDSLHQAYQQTIRAIQAQAEKDIQGLQGQFTAAKTIGQEQINALLLQLGKKQKQNAFLKNSLNQGLFLNPSTQLSQSLTPSTVQTSPNQRYMARFRNFAKMIDRKLFSSCDERDSNIFYSKVESKSGGQGKRQKLQQLVMKENVGVGVSSRILQAHREHRHHFSAN